MGLGEEDYRDEVLLSPQQSGGHDIDITSPGDLDPDHPTEAVSAVSALQSTSPTVLPTLYPRKRVTKRSSHSMGRVLSSTSLRGKWLHKLIGVICVGDLTPPLFIHSLDQSFLCVSMDSFTDIYFTLCIKILYVGAYSFAQIVSALAIRSAFRWLLCPFRRPHPFDL